MFTLDPSESGFLNSLDLLITLVGGIGALYLFFVGIERYRKEQVWKRREFIANEMKDFTSDPVAKTAMQLIDWGDRYVELFPGMDNYKDRLVRVDRVMLRGALLHHDLRKKDGEGPRFTPEEAMIRDTFDHFLSYFERFNSFVEANLVSPEELKPYLHYWVKAISKDMDDPTRNVVHHYINSYGFRGTQSLFGKLGGDIKPTTKIESTLVGEG